MGGTQAACVSESMAADAPPAAAVERVSKEQCIEAVQTLVACEFDPERSRWKEPVSREEGKAAHAIRWRVNTSLFFGATVREFGADKVWNEAKKRDEIPARLWNPAEQRHQDEALRGDDVYTGIVLRGEGEGAYGFATSDFAKLPKTVFQLSTDAVAVTEQDVPTLVPKLAKALRDELDRSEGAHIGPSHRAQLEAIAAGAEGGSEGERVVQAVQSLVQAGKASQLALCARAYGGGVWRVAVSLRTLGSALGRTSVAVPEMFGADQWTEYAHADVDELLVGFELRDDGKPSYVRLTRADLALDHVSF